MTISKSEKNSDDLPIDPTVTRRLLLRRSLGVAAPVVMTLASLPSHAAGVCINPSGFISQATFNSRHPGGMVCTDRGPNYFATLDVGSWPSTVMFTTVFGALASPNANRSATLKEVLSPQYPEFAKYCVAAYANASNPPLNFPITLPQSRALFKTITQGTPPSGLPAFPSFAWNEFQALEWLRTVMNA